MVLIRIAIVRILHVHVSATHVVQIAADITVNNGRRQIRSLRKAWFQHVISETELTQCLRYYVVRRCFDDLRWLEFSVAESDWRWKRAETMRGWPWRHWLLVICRNRSSSPNCQLMRRPNRWIHSTSCQSEKICRLAVESRALLCILLDGHCHKCTICKCLVRAHSDDLAQSSAHESHDIRPTDWFVAPKDLQTHTRTNTY